MDGLRGFIVAWIFFCSTVTLQAGCERSLEGNGLHGAASASFAPGGSRDPRAGGKSQEEELSALMDRVLEARWYLKKARAASDPNRVERLAREIEERLRALDASVNEGNGTGGFTDPACRVKLEEEILPALREIKQEWGRFLSTHLGCTPEELASCRDDMRTALEKGDREHCLALYRVLKARIGGRCFESAPLMEARLRVLLQEIAGIKERAERAAPPAPPPSRKVAPRKGAVPRPPVLRDPKAFLVNVRPLRGEPFPAVIQDRALIRLLVRKGRILPSDLDPGGRVTLHYMRGLNGSMGFAVEDLKVVTADLPLDEQGLRSVQAVIRRRIARTAGRAEKPAAPPQGRKAGVPKEGSAPSPAPPARTFPLLERFPPEKGWGPERKKEIERRKVVLGVFPGPEEQAFLEQYEAWCKEFAEREAPAGEKR